MRILRPGRVGLIAALNRGITEARAPLIARMDADDVMLPGRLRAQREMMDGDAELALCGTQVGPCRGARPSAWGTLGFAGRQPRGVSPR